MESITDKYIKSIENAYNDTNFYDLYDEFMALLNLEKEMNKYKIRSKDE